MSTYKPIRDYDPDPTLTGSVTKWVLWVIAFVMIVSVIGIVGNFSFGWFATPFRVASSQNVEAQFDQMLTRHQTTVAAAQNVCSAERNVNSITPTTQSDRDERQVRVTQLTAYEQTYRSNKAAYDAQASNVFKAGVIRPFDSTTGMTLPDRQPDLEQAKVMYCR